MITVKHKGGIRVVYITVKQPPMYRQMTLEELLFGTEIKSSIVNNNMTNTHTYVVDRVNDKYRKRIDVDKMIEKLAQFNQQTESLRVHQPRTDLYYTFHIPKKSGGLRRIDAPNDELKNALRNLKEIFENDFGCLYHTSAFAYMKGRGTIPSVKRHQANESKWFGKYDLSNFFGSTTPDFVMKMLSMIFPFSEIVKTSAGKAELSKALDLAFLNGGLPQGTPLSPTLTNIMMIPIDHKLSNGLRNFNNQSFVYTRYADDFLVSSKYEFKFMDVEKFIVDVLAEFGAPFTIKTAKTRYGSSAGSNWNLGVMLNKDNNITIGHKKKRQFQAMLSSYVLDKQNGHPWDRTDIQTLEGYRNYYRMVEGETIDKIVEHIGEKYHIDIVASLHDDLRI